MFTLRRISSEGVEMNQVLGEHYTYIDRWKCPKEFERSWKHYAKTCTCGENEGCSDCPSVPDYDPKSEDADKRIFGFVGNGLILQPLWSNQQAYIMTEGGKTFANLVYWRRS